MGPDCHLVAASATSELNAALPSYQDGFLTRGIEAVGGGRLRLPPSSRVLERQSRPVSRLLGTVITGMGHSLVAHHGTAP